MNKPQGNVPVCLASITGIVFLSILVGGFSYTLLVGTAGLSARFASSAFAVWVAAPAGSCLGFIFALAIHEFSHALGVRLVGGHIYRITLGKGPLVTQFPIMGTTCYLHASLLGGAVQYGLASPRHLRSKFAFVTASAPLASVALCVGCSGILAMLVQRSSELSIGLVAFATGLTASTFLCLPGTLLPFTFTFRGRKLKTDALRLLSIPWMTDEEIAHHVATNRPLIETRELIESSTLTLEGALKLSEAEPDNPKAIFTAAQFLREADDLRAMSYFRKLLNKPAPAPSVRIIYLDSYLTAGLELDAIRNDPEADQFSRELLDSKPDDLSLLGTRGSVLIELDRATEGKPMLESILVQTKNPLILAYSNLFLALAAKREGNIDLARTHAKAAEALASDWAPLRRVADLLEPAERRS